MYNFAGRLPIPFNTLKKKYATPPSKFININGVRVHYRDEGDSEIPIVLVHGFGAHLFTFNAWTEILRENYRVIRLDLPGFGLSDAFEDGDYRIGKYTTLLHDFVTELNVSACIIAGNSLGGNISWNFTLDYPAMVKKLILIDSAGYELISKKLLLFSQAAVLPKFDEMLVKYTTDSLVKKTIEIVYGDTARMKPENVEIYTDLFRREGNTKSMVDIRNSLELARTKVDPRINDLVKIKQPTLILWGEKDDLLPLSDATKFCINIPNSRLVIFKGAGHIPMEEIPEESLSPVLEFISND